MTGHAYIFDAIRTPRAKGKADGSLHEVKPISLVVQQLRALAERNRLDTSEVADVIMGCVTAMGEQGMNLAKIASMAAGWDEAVAGVTLNRFCASGSEAIHAAAARIAAGWDDLIVAGGVESMSRVPMGSEGGAWAQDPETTLATGFMPQGLGADLIATMEGFSREDLDRFAQASHQKALYARQQKFASSSIVPVRDQNGLIVLAEDELIRAEISLAALAQLKPSFAKLADLGLSAAAYKKYPEVEQIQFLHTAGNSSALSDGAAAVLVGSEAIGKRLKWTPRARILAAAVVGSEPTIMLTGPALASKKAIAKAGLSFDQIDLFEVNEAFASVVLKFQKDTQVPMEKINVNGGAIALGHPLGATGAMLTSTLIDELERQDLRYGVVTLCIGAGMGMATVIERLG